LHLHSINFSYPILTSFPLLSSQVQDRRISCVNVTRGVVGCAYAAHQQVNCLVSFIPSSVALAHSLDQMASPKGPLHGVPVSVKENINVEGHDITAGVAKLCNVQCSTTAVRLCARDPNNECPAPFPFPDPQTRENPGARRKGDFSPIPGCCAGASGCWSCAI